MARRRNGQLIETAQIHGKPVEAVVFFNIGPSALPHFPSEFGILHKLDQCRDETFEIVRLEQKTRLAVPDDT